MLGKSQILNIKHSTFPVCAKMALLCTCDLESRPIYLLIFQHHRSNGCWVIIKFRQTHRKQTQLEVSSLCCTGV